jgi:hypothetical protein
VFLERNTTSRIATNATAETSLLLIVRSFEVFSGCLDFFIVARAEDRDLAMTIRRIGASEEHVRTSMVDESIESLDCMVGAKTDPLELEQSEISDLDQNTVQPSQPRCVLRQKHG